MNIPYQAPAVNRNDAISSSIDASVAPAFWGALAKAALPIALDVGKHLIRKWAR